jgi:AcrR family transcriptional regulator
METRPVEKRERKTKAAQAEATRATILDVAQQLFSERGYAATLAEDVAEQAGVTRGALQHHFGDKRGLFLAVVARLSDRILARIIEVVSQIQGDSLQAVEGGCLAYLDVCADGAINRILFQDAPGVLTTAEMKALPTSSGSELLVSGIEKAIEDGFIEPVSAKALACMLLGALNCAGLEIARAVKPNSVRAAYAQLLVRLLDGLHPRDRKPLLPGSRSPLPRFAKKRQEARLSRP